jgi:hypothetical protein
VRTIGQRELVNFGPYEGRLRATDDRLCSVFGVEYPGTRWFWKNERVAKCFAGDQGSRDTRGPRTGW